MTQYGVDQAVHILRNGGLVAFPTETVYGLGADATNELAIRKVFQTKGRPSDHPLIVHIASAAQLSNWAAKVPKEAILLAEAFWPGPLTLVLRKQPHVFESITGGQNTVALRIPRHPLALALLTAFGGGLVAPSANKFTRISPTTASAVREELGNEVDMILDGGACEVGLESTIVDLTSAKPLILRPGMISAEAIEKVLQKSVKVARQDTPVETRAPGMHHVHYAPVTKTKLVKSANLIKVISKLNANELPIACMIYSDITLPTTPGISWVNLPKDPAGYAHELYRTLRAVDQQKFHMIIVEAVPEGVEWEAIRDRLIRASG